MLDFLSCNQLFLLLLLTTRPLLPALGTVWWNNQRRRFFLGWQSPNYVHRFTVRSYLFSLLRALFGTSVLCHKENKSRGEVVYRKHQSRGRRGMAWHRAALFTLWHVLYYLSLFTHTHTRARTHPYNPNQSPLIGEIAFKGSVKNK